MQAYTQHNFLKEFREIKKNIISTFYNKPVGKHFVKSKELGKILA